MYKYHLLILLLYIHSHHCHNVDLPDPHSLQLPLHTRLLPNQLFKPHRQRVHLQQRIQLLNLLLNTSLIN